MNNSEKDKEYDKKKHDMSDKNNHRPHQNQHDEKTKHGGKEEESKKENVSLEEEMSKKIKELEASLNEQKDKMLRVVAECENTKKRLQRDKDDAVSFANKQIIKDLIPCLDSLDAALSSAADESVKKGIELIKVSFLTVLKKWGIEEIDDEGKDYDPSRHEACLFEEDEEEHNDRVVLTLQKGYALHGQVIRPSKVKILKSKHE